MSDKSSAALGTPCCSSFVLLPALMPPGRTTSISCPAVSAALLLQPADASASSLGSYTVAKPFATRLRSAALLGLKNRQHGQ